MTALTRPIRRLLGRERAARRGRAGLAARGAGRRAGADRRRSDDARSRSISPSRDPLLAYLQSAPGPVELARLELDSPAVTALRDAGVALVVPLVSQGELIGTLNLGPRLSEQDYSTDDRRLLTTLAAQAAPAIRVAQLVREQAHEAAERERLEQEMRVATLIQQQFLPRELPSLPQWQIAAYYGPARAVGGDFYDFIEMPRRADRDRRRRRHRQGRARRRWSWPGRTRSCAPKPAGATPRARSWPAPTPCSSRRCRPGCS